MRMDFLNKTTEFVVRIYVRYYAAIYVVNGSDAVYRKYIYIIYYTPLCIMK